MKMMIRLIVVWKKCPIESVNKDFPNLPTSTKGFGSTLKEITFQFLCELECIKANFNFFEGMWRVCGIHFSAANLAFLCFLYKVDHRGRAVENHQVPGEQ